MKHPFQTPAVAKAFDTMPRDNRAHIVALRTLIFDTGAALLVGRIEESLKWGQPSYNTPDSKAATPIRLGITKTGDIAVFTHCQATVMSDFRALAPADMRFDGNRALLLDADKPFP